jgi:flagellum-specific peptidoglycan hydrolase FlgJ
MALTEQQKAFIQVIRTAAIPVAANVPMDLIISAAILESNWGTSRLTRLANNLFGIKGKGVNLSTAEIINGKPVIITAGFKKYPTYQDSIKDYVQLLNTTRYKAALNKPTLYEKAKAIQAAGYSTNSNYATVIHNIAKSLSNSTTLFILPLLFLALILSAKGEY